MLIVLLFTTPVLEFDWLMFDDDINILVNPYLGGGLSTVRWAFENVDYMRRYLPLGWIGFETLLAIDGYNATLFHAAGWLLSGLNGALMCLILAHVLRPAGAGRRTHVGLFPWLVALLAALFWSLHPLRVENAAWISGLLYLASTTLACLAVLVHLRVTRQDDCAPGHAAPPYLRLLGALFYLASLLVYPVFLSLPALLWWYQVASARRGERLGVARLAARRLGGWWIAAVFALAMNIYARVTSGDLYEPLPSWHATDAFSLLTKFARAVLHYVAITVWPADVAIVYSSSENWVHPAMAAGILISAGALLVFPATRWRAFAWMVAGGLALLPFLGVYDRSFQPNDRYAVLWLAVCAAALGRMILRAQQHRTAAPAALLVALLAVSLLAISYRSALYVWRDTPALQAVIDRMETRLHPRLNITRPAWVAWLQGDRIEADRRLLLGKKTYPHSEQIRDAEAQLAQSDDAWRRRVGASTQISPLALLHFDLGRAWQQRGKPRAARAHFARAIKLAPDFAAALQAYQETRRANSR